MTVDRQMIRRTDAVDALEYEDDVPISQVADVIAGLVAKHGTDARMAFTDVSVMFKSPETDREQGFRLTYEAKQAARLSAAAKLTDEEWAVCFSGPRPTTDKTDNQGPGRAKED